MFDLKAMQRPLEELTLSTSPAIHQRAYDGWVLRASGTDTRRANSTTILHESTLPLDEKIAFCEAWYARHRQPTIIRLTEEFAPPTLDALLAARGYTREGETFVMTSIIHPANTLSAPPAGVRIVVRTTAEGIADLHQLKDSGEQMCAQDTARQSLWRGEEVCLALKTINGLAAVGLARIENGFVGVFNMRTVESQRGKGYATALVAAMLEWGRSKGAHSGFLQVDCANAPALAVYRRFGFRDQYRYWYRVMSALQKS
jgi:GNAT superfamily N-acetyltransferase